MSQTEPNNHLQRDANEGLTAGNKTMNDGGLEKLLASDIGAAHQNFHQGASGTRLCPRPGFGRSSRQPRNSGPMAAESPTKGLLVKSGRHERLNSASRLRFRCDLRALELLCCPEAISRLEVAAESLNTRDRRRFLRGYRLAVATPLNEMLRFVVDEAELMGLEQDDRLFNWLHFRSPARGESLLSAVSDPTSGLGCLCYVFNNLAIALRRAEGALTDTTAAIEKCRATAKLFDDVQTGTEFVSLDPGEELPDRESLLRLCVVSMAVRS